MAMSDTPKTITFSTIRIKANNTKLEKDEKGYYRVILGAINAFNESGDFYVEDGVKDLISNKSSALYRRLSAGYLKGELGHPKYEMGMSKAQYFGRNQRIEEGNVSHHIRDLILTPTNQPCGIPGGGNIILVEGWITPSGPHGEALRKSLENEDENVAFSVRSFTEDRFIGGVNRKKIHQLITYDWVTEPGIRAANKFSLLDGKISLESLDMCDFKVDEIGAGNSISECFNCSLESKEEKDMTLELLKSVGVSNALSDIINW